MLTVDSSETDRRETGVDANEAVMVVGNVELASVLSSIVVRVSNQRTLPVSRELAPGDGNEIGGMSDVK